MNANVWRSDETTSKFVSSRKVHAIVRMALLLAVNFNEFVIGTICRIKVHIKTYPKRNVRTEKNTIFFLYSFESETKASETQRICPHIRFGRKISETK